MTAKYEMVESDEDLTELIGVSVHTGLRKGTDAEDSHILWKAISDSETEAWSDAAAWALYCIRASGYDIVKVVVE